MCPPDPPHTLTWVQVPGGFADFPLFRSLHLVALGLMGGSSFSEGFPTWAWGLSEQGCIFPGGFHVWAWCLAERGLLFHGGFPTWVFFDARWGRRLQTAGAIPVGFCLLQAGMFEQLSFACTWLYFS